MSSQQTHKSCEDTRRSDAAGSQVVPRGLPLDKAVEAKQTTSAVSLLRSSEAVPERDAFVDRSEPSTSHRITTLLRLDLFPERNDAFRVTWLVILDRSDRAMSRHEVSVLRVVEEALRRDAFAVRDDASSIRQVATRL